ncbi:MAG TPA: hypothetical protein VKO45_07715 [Methanomicrobiales archaeon]|nr:hypothetical protein [Methanomicrobiales archaeon]
MDDKTAVKEYQFGERAKSELILVSQLLLVLGEMKDREFSGGKRILLALMEGIRSELEFAHRGTGAMEFQRAVNHLNEAIGIVESGQPGPATLKIADAISDATTAAQAAWQVLSAHGLL